MHKTWWYVHHKAEILLLTTVYPVHLIDLFGVSREGVQVSNHERGELTSGTKVNVELLSVPPLYYGDNSPAIGRGSIYTAFTRRGCTCEQESQKNARP